MTNRFLLLLFAGVVMLATAESPVASLLCMGPIQINGIKLVAEAVYAWPVLAQDEVATEAATAIVLFPDKSRILLDRNTRVRFTKNGESIMVALLTGQFGYLLTPQSQIQLTPERIPLASSSGSVSLRGGNLAVLPGSGGLPGEKPGRASRGLPSLGMYLPQ